MATRAAVLLLRPVPTGQRAALPHRRHHCAAPRGIPVARKPALMNEDAADAATGLMHGVGREILDAAAGTG